MSLTVMLTYTGKNGNARRFAEEMESSGIAERIRAEKGNVRYSYYQPLDDPESILLIDQWKDQKSLDAHHASAMMQELAVLRDKYDLHMRAERYQSLNDDPSQEKYLRQ